MSVEWLCKRRRSSTSGIDAIKKIVISLPLSGTDPASTPLVNRITLKWCHNTHSCFPSPPSSSGPWNHIRTLQNCQCHDGFKVIQLWFKTFLFKCTRSYPTFILGPSLVYKINLQMTSKYGGEIHMTSKYGDDAIATLSSSTTYNLLSFTVSLKVELSLLRPKANQGQCPPLYRFRYRPLCSSMENWRQKIKSQVRPSWVWLTGDNIQFCNFFL